MEIRDLNPERYTLSCQDCSALGRARSTPARSWLQRLRSSLLASQSRSKPSIFVAQAPDAYFGDISQRRRKQVSLVIWWQVVCSPVVANPHAFSDQDHFISEEISVSELLPSWIQASVCYNAGSLASTEVLTLKLDWTDPRTSCHSVQCVPDQNLYMGRGTFNFSHELHISCSDIYESGGGSDRLDRW